MGRKEGRKSTYAKWLCNFISSLRKRMSSRHFKSQFLQKKIRRILK